KTGTLTTGEPRLTDVVPAAGRSDRDLLQVAVAVESASDHPLARAVVRDGAARLGDVPAARATEEASRSAIGAATDVVALTGRGIRAVIDGVIVRAGSAAMFTGQLDAAMAATVGRLQLAGRTTIVVAVGDDVLGVLGVMDTPRTTARAAIESLRSLGMSRAVLLSGDHQAVADAVAGAVGIDEAWGDLLPDDKVAAITRLRDEAGQVAMVGDGVNDAPALAHATVGIAMGAAGSDVALESADIALMGDDLSALPAIVGLSRRSSRIIRQNLLISLGMVALLVPATLVGAVGIGPAVVAHEGSTLIVVANALRLLAFRPAADRRRSFGGRQR
ncbi:MAG TPA: HAD-IC family P-type ATPase, partial [Ilumatobacteraceae bacterium]|nr:HAD-IC family P-type ATPase [Ilumatobacteraceae bacterium]